MNRSIKGRQMSIAGDQLHEFTQFVESQRSAGADRPLRELFELWEQQESQGSREQDKMAEIFDQLADRLGYRVLTREEFSDFHRFVETHFAEGRQASLQELVELWEQEFDLRETLASLRRAEEDSAAGRFYTLEEARELSRRHLEELARKAGYV